MESPQRATDTSGETADSALAERLLDQAIELTFPASDPVSVVSAFHAARVRDERS